MYQYLTNLFFAAVVAVVLPVGSAHAFHKGVVHGGGGGETIQTLDSLDDGSCTAGYVAKFDGSNWFCAVDASAADCGVGQYLDGDGTCKDVSTITPDTTIPDTNAGTLCETGQYLDGDGTGSCLPIPADTNAATECDIGQILVGDDFDGTCVPFVEDPAFKIVFARRFSGVPRYEHHPPGNG